MLDEDTYVQRAIDKIYTGEGPALLEIAAEMEAQGLDSSLVRRLDQTMGGQRVKLADALSALFGTVWRELQAVLPMGNPKH